MEYEIGKWYIATDNRKCFFYVTKIEYDEEEELDFVYAYGLDWQGKWTTDEVEYDISKYYNPNEERLARIEEVEEMLFEEAKRRYNGKSAKCLHDCDNLPIVQNIELEFDGVCLRHNYNGCGCIYENGKWAEPITEEKKKEELNDRVMKYEIGERVLVGEDIGEIDDIDYENEQYYIYFDDTEDWVDEYEISPIINQNKVEQQKSESMNEFEEMELAYKNAERLSGAVLTDKTYSGNISSGNNGRHRDGFTVNRPVRNMDFASSKYNRRR